MTGYGKICDPGKYRCNGSMLPKLHAPLPKADADADAEGRLRRRKPTPAPTPTPT
jgi:hypothetical protein